MNKTVFKKLKVWLPALGFVGATLFSACEQGEPNIDNPNTQKPNDSTEQTDTTPQDTTPETQYRDVYINYSLNNGADDSLVTYDMYGEMHISPTLIRYDSMPDVRYIYIYVSPDDYSFMNCSAISIYGIVNNTLKPAMEYSKKTRAKGTFYFRAGEPSKVPEDSLWLTQQGWSVKNQNQM
ncbi:MAG: hypothetical protein IAA73_11290 [Bacteroidetes bacterium]|uniref:Lipoprotein n=1 Tax=Candidatus Gallipaludibacter merdavium TaxID=2840839 RepID=A0A9D9N5G6_9BACT|nr:hypothetical protein [Candidatus Gallipaludibacter merdavium]